MTCTLKEQIIKAVQDATDIVDGTVSIPILDHFLDGILNEQLRQLNVPSDEEIKEMFTTSHYHYEKGHYRKVRLDRIQGARQIREEIIKRNQK